MKWSTELPIPKSSKLIGADDKLLLIGSCFSDNIGAMMAEYGLHVVCNPTGVLYNPLSIATALNGDMRVEIVEHEGLYHSMSHHSRFSGPDRDEVLGRCLRSLMDLHQAMAAAQWVFVTFGTAYVYYRNGQVVANCHKLPEREFQRRRIDIDDILSAWRPIIRNNSDKHFVFTVSPIRHQRDGLHANQLSKAVLLFAIERLQQEFAEEVQYFPAYEILLDELRDYRFYAEDLVHPSQVAVGYIWQRLCDTYFDSQTFTELQRRHSLWLHHQHRPLLTIEK